MSGFTGSGYPKAVPAALARPHRRRPRARRGSSRSTSDGGVHGAGTRWRAGQGGRIQCGCRINLIRPCGTRINAGELDYQDIHLSHVAQYAWFGLFGELDVAVVEVAGIREDGLLIPSASVGNNKTWLDQGEARDPRGEFAPAARARRHARHLLRHCDCRRTGCRFRS